MRRTRIVVSVPIDIFCEHGLEGVSMRSVSARQPFIAGPALPQGG